MPHWPLVLPRWLAAHPSISALAAAGFIAASGIIYRQSGVAPETASFFRAFYGLPLLALVAFFERRRSAPLSNRARLVAVVAGVFFALDLAFWHHSIDAVGAGLATVLGNLQVVMVAIVAWLVFREQPNRRTLVALPIILLGVVLISGVIGANAYGADPPLGVLLGVLTAVAYGAYLLVIRPIARVRLAEPVAIATASTAAVGLVIGLAVGRLDLAPSWPAHGWLLLLGVTAQSIAYLLISISLPRLPAVMTSIILLAQPVMAVFLSMALINETPSPAQLAGVGLVISGIALATIPVARLRARIRPRPVTTP